MNADEFRDLTREYSSPLKVAITWHEMWYQGLEDAANLYFTDKDVEGMLLKLDEVGSGVVRCGQVWSGMVRCECVEWR